MQKKSLLVALFCGALCLTGCLKNEESASVAQVRMGKAAELNSIAKLNEAKAAAEGVYAQAALTVAQAEAKLNEAKANLINAKAETEKIRAELLKVRVALAEVQVDEEKVRLLMLEADLQQKLAEVEAAVAMAEAEKQGWINVLEHALADAERQAIEDAKAILEAEDALEAYVLTQETEKAKLAKKAANKYFKALADVQELQREQLEVQVRKALVEAGAVEIRDGIHYAIAQIDEEIAKKEAIVAYLKEYQTATPEEIEEQLKEAWATLNDAYAEWGKAFAAEQTAQASFEAAEGVQSTYVDNWTEGFAGVVKGLLDGETIPNAEYGQYGYGENYYVDEETGVKYNAAVITDEDGKVVEIIPLWTASAPNKEQYKEEYLIPEVIEGIKIPRGGVGSLTNIKTRTYFPAKIEFENVENVFAAYKAYQEEVVLPEFDEKVAEFTEEQKEKIEERIEGWKADKQYFDDYVANATRAAMVEEAEQALEDSIASANKTHGAVRKAFEAYRDYMVMTYDVDRKYFERRYKAKDSLTVADGDSTEWQSILDKAKANAEDMFKALEEAELLAHKLGGAYVKACEDSTAAAASSAADTTNARKSWNPEFDPQGDTTWNNGSLYNKVGGVLAENTKAGTSQVSTVTAKTLMEEKETALRDAQWLAAYWTGYGDAEKAAAEQAKITALTPQYESAVNSYNAAVTAEAEAKAAYFAAKGKLAKAIEAKHKAYDTYMAAVADLYPSDSNDDEAEPTTWDEYVAAVRDTLLAKVANVEVDLNFYPRKYSIADIDEINPIPDDADPEDVAEGEIYANYTIAQKAAWFAKQHTVKTEALAKAEEELLEQLAFHMNVKPEDIESTEDETADKLYEAWQKAEDDSDYIMGAAMANLRKVYWQCANQDHRGRFSNDFFWVNASYQVDPEYQFISGYEWDAENETYVLIKKYFRSRTRTIDGEEVEVPNYRRSLGGRIEIAEAILADEEEFAENCKKAYIGNGVDPHDVYAAMLEKIEKATKGLAEKKAVEAAYVASVENRNTTHAAWVDAQIETIVAKAVYELALEEYNALKAIQDEGIWVYDPDAKIFEQVYDREPRLGDGEIRDFENDFTLVPIAKEIERIEGTTDVLHEMIGNLIFTSITEGEMPDFDEIEIDTQSIAGLSFAKKLLQEALKQGKLGLQVVIAAFDEELAVLDEKIQVYSAIAEKFKAVMNAYLGIVENAEGETGPLDGEGEGDDEE